MTTEAYQADRHAHLPLHESSELSQVRPDAPAPFERVRRATPIARVALSRLGSEALGTDYGPARRRSGAVQYESPELRRQRL